MDRTAIESILHDKGFDVFKWMSSKDVLVNHWVRFKCMFGCGSYGTKGSCPPSMPAIEECRAFFREYDHIAVIHLEQQLADPEDRGNWSRKNNVKLLKLEKAAFLAGFHKAFLLFVDECRICDDCPGTRAECKHLNLSRPCPESLGVDVFTTVRQLGCLIEVLSDYEKPMNRYSFLLVE